MCDGNGEAVKCEAFLYLCAAAVLRPDMRLANRLDESVFDCTYSNVCPGAKNSTSRTMEGDVLLGLVCFAQVGKLLHFLPLCDIRGWV